MADAIFEVLSETGNLQVTGTGGIGYGLSATGSLVLVNDGASHPQPMVVGQVTVAGANPVFAFKANGNICVERVTVSGGTTTFRLRAQSNVSIGVQWWVFDTAASSIKDSTMAGIEAAIYDEFGVMTFDATMAALRIANAIETPKTPNELPEGRFVALQDTTDVNVPAGRVYAIVQATPAFVFLTHDSGGYSSSPTRPDRQTVDDGGGVQPGTRWREQSLQSYQATGGYAGGSTIRVGLTRFEQFYQGWQPVSSQPRIDIHGQARHLIIDVTNFTSAGGVSPTIVTVGVNASTRSVSTGGATTIPHSSTPAVTASASGGTAPYSYLWEFVSGNDEVSGAGLYNGASFYTQTVNQPQGTIRSAIYRLRVTDANGFVGYSPDVTFSHTAEAVDTTPNALSFVNWAAPTNDPTIWTSQTAQVTGINTPITLRVERYEFSGYADAVFVHTYTGPSAGGPWTHKGSYSPQAAGYQYTDVVVQPNEWVHTAYAAETYSGRRDVAWRQVVWNMSGTGLIADHTVALAVDADNNHNKTALDPINWADFAFTINEHYGILNHNGQNATGITVPITIRATIDQYSGGMTDGYLRFYNWNNGAPQLRGEVRYAGGGGTLTGTVNPGEHIYFSADAITNSGAKAVAFRVVVTNDSAGGALVDTFNVGMHVDANNDYNIGPDVTPDAFSVPYLSAVGNDANVYTAAHFQQITGINQPITLRWTRDSLVQAGNVFTRRLHVWKSTSGTGGPWEQLFLGAGAGAVLDVQFNNGDWFYTFGQVDTTSGASSASWRNYITNLNTGQQLAVYDIAAIADNDNNYNVATGPTASLSEGYMSGYATIIRPGRVTTATAIANLSISGGTAPYTVAVELSGVSGQSPTATVSTSQLSLRISANSSSSSYGQVRVRVTDAVGQVGYTAWTTFDLFVEDPNT